MTFRQKFIGDKVFYKSLFVLILPLIVQQGVTGFVSLLDNVMVGRLGTAAMNSVAIVNQLIFVFNMVIFGGLSGASIFGAQFAGADDVKGMRHTFRLKMIFSVAVSAIAIAILFFFGDRLALLFLDNEANAGADISSIAEMAKDYLLIMLVGLLPYAAVQAYSSSLREMGETVVPMIASVTAIFVNLVLNYLLIFGKFGFPKLGVVGAAIATVISRYVEASVVIIYTHVKHAKFRFIEKAYSSLYIPRDIIMSIAKTGSPLMFNEILWSLAMTFINKSYSTRGLEAVAASNITSTAWNLFCVIMFAMGTAVSIIVGRELGRGEREKAIELDTKLLFVSFAVHIVIAAFLIGFSGLIPELYETEETVKAIASKMLVFAGLSMPLHALVHCIYFTIRSGGKTVVTFLFDCVYTWVANASLAFCLCRFTSLPVEYVYLCVQFIDVLKLTIGIIMLKSGFWANTVIKPDVPEKQ